MKAFAALYTALDETTKTNRKVKALVSYFKSASPADAAWAVYFLIGKKPKAIIQMPKLVNWLIDLTNLPEWLFAESYDAVGDLAETMAILLPAGESTTDLPLHTWVEERLLPLKTWSEEDQKKAIFQYWQGLNERERFIYNKLLTGAFRVGVSEKLVVKALALCANLDEASISHRLMGNWHPSPEFFNGLIAVDTTDSDISRPYPFFLAYPLQTSPETLGNISDWQIEWKWDGIRSQIISRKNNIFIWSRGEELVTERYPELAVAAQFLPDGVVVDGEILVWKNGAVQPFAELQKRIGRKVVTKKMLEDLPVILMAYDLLEFDNCDWRSRPLLERRQQLETLLLQLGEKGNGTFKLSPVLSASDWNELTTKQSESRQLNVEGVMLKRLQSTYKIGRQRGDWWKWKVDPYTVDAVLIYAQAGSGRRASLYTDYTFGVWDNGKLVPIAKAYSGLTDEEIGQVDQFVRKNTIEKFGPVRTVKPELVFELAFEAIQPSTRHKSGIAVRFPRIARWRQDKPATEADSLNSIKALLERESPHT
jgi:DNA ligase-1